MSDHISTSIGKLSIRGGSFEGMAVTTDRSYRTPGQLDEEQVKKLLTDLYTVLKTHGFHGHISLSYRKEIGTKVNT